MAGLEWLKSGPLGPAEPGNALLMDRAPPSRWSTACLRRSAPTARSFAERHDPAWMGRASALPSRRTAVGRHRRRRPRRAGHPRKARSAPLPLELPSGKPSRWLSRPQDDLAEKTISKFLPIRRQLPSAVGRELFVEPLNWTYTCGRYWDRTSDLLGVNELHASRLRSSTPVKGFPGSYEVDAGRRRCCTFLLYRRPP